MSLTPEQAKWTKQAIEGLIDELVLMQLHHPLFGAEPYGLGDIIPIGGPDPSGPAELVEAFIALWENKYDPLHEPYEYSKDIGFDELVKILDYDNKDLWLMSNRDLTELQTYEDFCNRNLRMIEQLRKLERGY